MTVLAFITVAQHLHRRDPSLRFRIQHPILYHGPHPYLPVHVTDRIAIPKHFEGRVAIVDDEGSVVYYSCKMNDGLEELIDRNHDPKAMKS